MKIFIKKASIFLVTGLLFILPGCSSQQTFLLDPYWAEYEKNNSRTFPSKNFRSALPYAAGQYIVFGYLKKVNRDHIEKHTVVRKDKGGWVYETIIIDKKGKTTGSQTLQGHELVKKGNDTVKMTWTKYLRDDGTVERIEYEVPEVPEIPDEYKDLLNKFMPSKDKPEDKVIFIDGQPVTVPAGIFKGTTYITTEKIHQSGKKIPKIYLYPDVPINGMVRMADENDNTLMELLDFGKNGKPFICTCTRTDRHINHSCEKK